MTDPVRQFEAAFAAWLGARHGLAFWKGRVALYAILRALGVGEGDEVILPGYTCVVAVNPVKFLGARPVYVDIEPATYNLDPDLVESKITPRTKVIIAQHTYGYPAEMDAILDIANRHGLPVIEDSCLAIGSTYKGRKTGTFGLAAFWSFQWNKTFTTGIGGMVTTSDADLAAQLMRGTDLVSVHLRSKLPADGLTVYAAYNAATWHATHQMRSHRTAFATSSPVSTGPSRSGFPTPEAQSQKPRHHALAFSLLRSSRLSQRHRLATSASAMASNMLPWKRSFHFRFCPR